ncbi:MAG: DUF547 domain-containing protein [Robiginitalea sp.]
MTCIFLFLSLLLHSADPGKENVLPESDALQDPPSHKVWDQLLKKYVSPDGWVDYRGFDEDREALISYLEILGDHSPTALWGRETVLAYYINLYNAATVLLILEHYPLESIRDIPRPWGKKRIQIGDQRYSLGEIEHEILRKMGDPRIHFAINCASLSCPKLLAQAYAEETLESQLEEVARGFINDPSRNDFSGEKPRLSRIFKWYRKDFTTRKTSLIDFLNRYLPVPLPAKAQVSYLPYNWALNKKRH